MKSATILGWLAMGIFAASCGSSENGQDFIDFRPKPETRGAGGSGGTSMGTGTGGVGGSVVPPLPPGVGGSAGVAGAAGSAGSVNPKAGTYSEAVVEAEDPPPPIAGGTLAIVGQGRRAAVSDPDNDQVVVVDLDTMTIASIIALQHGDEPGRIIEDSEGRLHVALRRGRAVAVLDTSTSSVVARLPVCVHPRGLAFETYTNAVHVACAGGELVSYAAASGVPMRKLRLERDLRDVVVDGDRLLVSRFRAAELLVVESNGTVSAKLRPPTPPLQRDPFPRIAAVAWRTVASPDGGALMVYQSLGAGSVQTTPGGYGGTCGGIVSTSVSVLRVDGSTATVDNVPAVLPVDIATLPTREFAVAAAAWAPGSKTALQWVARGTPPNPSTAHPRTALGCIAPPPPPTGPVLQSEPVPQGRVVAVAWGPEQKLVFQTREPATLMFGEQAIALPGRTRKHTGHELFHLGTLGGLACASCHPEGHEDGQVWNFAKFGPRRTQSISGGIRGTEPFHWSGDMTTFSTLAHDVFNSRMTGPALGDEHVESLLRWIDSIPNMEPPAADDPAAAERGRELFNDPSVGCASCHSGEKLTNNATVNVGTAGAFQVPSLVGLAWRAPYMHQGCASSLDQRFVANCGGGESHGHTAGLTDQQRADLVAYLDTL